MISQSPAGAAQSWHLLMLSAKSEAALASLAGNLVKFLRSEKKLDLADVSFTLLAGRELLELRQALVCRDLEDAVQVLQGYQPQRLLTAASPATNRKIAFSFTDRDLAGMEMARAIYATQPVFRKEVERCTGSMAEPSAFDLHGLFFPERVCHSSAEAALSRPEIAQPACFVFQYALAKLWLSWGLQPDVLVGEGAGECVAAHLAGSISLEDAFYLAMLRGRALQYGRASAADERAESRIRGILPLAPRIPYVSGITGNWVEADAVGRGEYCLELAYRPVASGASAAGLLMDGDRLLLEVGSGKISDPLPEQVPMGESPSGTGRNDPAMADGWCWLLNTLGALAVRGARIDWQAHFADRAVKRISLPTYPFEPRRHWFVGAKEVREQEVPRGAESSQDQEGGQGKVTPSRHGPVEDFLIVTCQDLLGIGSIGLNDNVMQLGMDSMNVMQLSLKVNEAFRISLAPHHLFSRPTLASLAEKIQSQRPDLKADGALAPATARPVPRPRRGESDSAEAQLRKLVENLSDAEVNRMLLELGAWQGNSHE